MTARLVPLQIGVGQAHAQHLGLRHGGVHELLAQVVVGDALDAPALALLAVRAVGIGRAEHREALPPPAVDGVLHHGLLLGRAAHHHQQRFISLALMEGLLLAHAHHRTRIRAIRAAAQRHLIHDGRAVHQPADHAHIGPGERGVVEDRAVLGAARVQRVQHLVAAGAERLCGAVQIEAMPRLVLHLGDENRLALQARRAADPVALGQHADDLAVRVLADLAHQRLAVGLGHPVLRFDAAVVIDALVELRHQFGRFGDRCGTHGRLPCGIVRNAE